MSGTKEGAAKSVAKLLANDPNHFKRIGRKGGASSNTGGFAANPALAVLAGKKGGVRRRGGRKCYCCLDFTHDNVKGFCAACQPQDTPALRALLGINAEGKKERDQWTQPKVNSVSSSSVMSASKTEKHQSRKSPGQPTTGSSTSSDVRGGIGYRFRKAFRGHFG